MDLNTLSPNEYIEGNQYLEDGVFYFIKDVSEQWDRNPIYAHIIIEKDSSGSNIYLDESNNIEPMSKSQLTLIDFSYPFKLVSIDIPKPWGKEVWFTGIEKRGISKVMPHGATRNFRLSTLIKVFGQKFLENLSPSPILLKILAPHDDPNFGNLYYELHNEKQEVYIISKVSPSWQNGVGRMKYGINSKKMSEFPSKDDFKNAFKDAVKNYEACRKKIDQFTDHYRAKLDFEVNENLDLKTLKSIRANMPTEIIDEEKNSKAKLEEFVGWLQLSVGDVVSVETRVPHSLQHGIEAIEFQSPVYERCIISFDQKVITQPGWDVDKAFGLMEMKPPAKKQLSVLTDSKSQLKERVVKFSDFEVSRVELRDKINLDASSQHLLIYLLRGEVRFQKDENGEEITLNEGEAYYVAPRKALSTLSRVDSKNPLILIASPTTNSPS